MALPLRPRPASKPGSLISPGRPDSFVFLLDPTAPPVWLDSFVVRQSRLVPKAWQFHLAWLAQQFGCNRLVRQFRLALNTLPIQRAWQFRLA